MAENPISGLADKKVFGIPVLWLLLGAGVVALYGAFAMKPAEEPVEELPDGEDIEGDESGDTSVPVFQATPVIYQPSGGSVASTAMPDTNEMWARRSIEFLIANGSTLGVATTAIDKYLNGEDLSYPEAQARDKAVRQFGLPPEGILRTNNPSAPKPSPAAPASPNTPPSTQGKPPLKHTVRNTRDDSAAELARIYYGASAGGADTNLIASYNDGRRTFPVGSKVTIPKKVQPKYFRATSAANGTGEIARKNGTTPDRIKDLNKELNFPVKAGTRVRVQ